MAFPASCNQHKVCCFFLLSIRSVIMMAMNISSSSRRDFQSSWLFAYVRLTTRLLPSFWWKSTQTPFLILSICWFSGKILTRLLRIMTSNSTNQGIIFFSKCIPVTAERRHKSAIWSSEFSPLTGRWRKESNGLWKFQLVWMNLCSEEDQEANPESRIAKGGGKTKEAGEEMQISFQSLESWCWRKKF